MVIHMAETLYSPAVLWWGHCRLFSAGSEIIMSGRARRESDEAVNLFSAIRRALHGEPGSQCAALCVNETCAARGAGERVRCIARHETCAARLLCWQCPIWGVATSAGLGVGADAGPGGGSGVTSRTASTSSRYMSPIASTLFGVIHSCNSHRYGYSSLSGGGH